MSYWKNISVDTKTKEGFRDYLSKLDFRLDKLEKAITLLTVAINQLDNKIYVGCDYKDNCKRIKFRDD